MPFGDSNTRGTLSEPAGGYRLPLQSLLDSVGCSYDFVGSQTLHSAGMKDPEHEGIGGWQLLHLLKGHDEPSRNIRSYGAHYLMEHYHPDVILLMAGVNDIFANVSGKEIAVRLRNLLMAMFNKNPDVRILVGNLSPLASSKIATGEVKLDYITQLEEYNRRIPVIVENFRRMDYKIGFVDMNSSVSESQLADDVHLNAEGMSNMAKAWFEGLTRYRFLK